MAITGPYRTSTDLITAVLAELGILAAGQTPDPEDVSYVSVELDSIFRKLAALELNVVQDPNQIRSEFYRDLVSIVAGEVAMKFNVNPDDYAKYKIAGLGGIQGIDVGFGAAAKSLRHIVRGRATFEVLRIEYL